ncbi:unnamed protein product [Closterium sp. NIES-54]
MALRPSTAPLRVPLPSPPESSLPFPPDPESDSLRAASPTVTHLLATVVTDPSFESTAASALVAELVDFAARCRLDYATSLVAASESVCPPSVGGECALSTDVLEDRQEEFQCFAAALPHLVSTLLAPEGDPDAPDIRTPRSYTEATEGPYSSQWQAAMDAEMASWKSTSTYVDEVPPPRANIVSGMWIFRVKRPPGSPPVFKARYVARGFSQRQGVDYFQTFSPTPKMTTLRVLLHVAAQRDYELHSLDFSTAFLQGSLHEEIWLRRPPGFTGSFLPGTQWSLRRPVYGLRQAPREWHDTLRTTLAALGFALSTADPSLFLRTDTSLPPFYILVYVDDLVFATADTPASGAAGAGATGGVDAGVGPAGGTAGATGSAGVGAVGAEGAAGAGAATGDTGAVPVGSGGPARPRPYFVPLLEQVLGLPPFPGPAPPLECPQPVQSQSPFQPVSPLPAPSPYAGPTGGLAERREPASRPALPVCTSRLAPRPRPPAVPGTHQMTLRPSTAPLRVPLPSPPESSLPVLADPGSDSLRAASPTVVRLLSTVVTDPSFESTAALALVAELVDFAARCRLDYAAILVAESESVCPPSVGGECALSTDVLEDRQEEFQCFPPALPHLVSTLIAPEGDPDAPYILTPRSYAEAIEGPYSSQWEAAMDAEMASSKSIGTYVNDVPPPGANIVSGMWIFRV